MMVNTLAIAERLQETGIPERQAKAIAYELAGKETRLATKEDIAEVKESIADVKKSIARLEGRMDR